MGERTEALWRILVAIVSGIIMGIWNYIMGLVIVVHWILVLLSGKRIKELSEFANQWASFVYRFYRYIGFACNSRPWPFADFGKPMEKVDMKKPK